MKPTLLVLAAGMGSRYGGLKQMDGVGHNGETSLVYSVNDANSAGFGKAVFVIRQSSEHADIKSQRPFILHITTKHILVNAEKVLFGFIHGAPPGSTF